MHTDYKKFLIAAVLLVSLILNPSRDVYAVNSAWEVLLDGMPMRLSTADAGINTTLYILKQTHEPLFRIDDGENYTSRLLENWNRSVDSRQYVFCPNTTLLFEPGRAFTSNYFEDYIYKATSTFDPNSRVSRIGNCFKVDFKKSRKQFLNYLTLYEHAPTIKKDDKTEIGLGPFYPISISERRIVLRRKSPISRGYNSIIIYPYAGPNDKNLVNRDIVDFNRVAVSAIPSWVQREYSHFDSVILKTVVLIINYPDKKIRQILYNCIDVNSFRQAFYPNRTDFGDVQNILPIGVPGARGGKVLQNCTGPHPLPAGSPDFIFINLGSNNTKQLNSFLADFHVKTGIKVKIKDYSEAALFNALFAYPRGYNLAVVAMDAVRPEYSAFFDYIVKKDGYLDFKLSHVLDLYQTMLNEDDSEHESILGARVAQLLSEEYVVLPLYQDTRRFYYPREIKNLTIGRGFLEYPEVADFRW